MVSIIDEISMIGREISGHFDLTLKAIMQNLLPFARVSLFIVGDFLKHPRVNQISVFMKSCRGSYRSFNRWLLEKF